MHNEVGFTSVLLGSVSLADALQQVPGVPNLVLVASGPPPPNPAELLTSDRVDKLLDEIAANCRLRAHRQPSGAPGHRRARARRVVDATIVVVAADSSKKKDVSRAFELLTQIDAPVVGTVLNDVDPSRGYDAGYASYGYVYRAEPSRRQSRRARKKAAKSAAAQPSSASRAERVHLRAGTTPAARLSGTLQSPRTDPAELSADVTASSDRRDRPCSRAASRGRSGCRRADSRRGIGSSP